MSTGRPPLRPIGQPRPSTRTRLPLAQAPRTVKPPTLVATTDNPSGAILKENPRATGMEVANAGLPCQNATLSSDNGSSVDDLVLAECAANSIILDSWETKTNNDTEKQILQRSYNDVECCVSVPHTEGIVDKPRFYIQILDTGDDAGSIYHRILGDGFKEWAEKVKWLLTQDPDPTPFGEATAALETLNDDFSILVLHALGESVRRHTPHRPNKPPWWCRTLKRLKNRAIIENNYYRAISEGPLAGSNLALIAQEDALEARKDFQVAYDQVALAWWQHARLLLTAGLANAMMRSINCCIRAKQNTALLCTTQHESKQAISAVRVHFDMVLSHSA
ncbi:hypothetical protein IWW39_001241 [Coemansia spiralis]|uniref:Uncharacterized protein n=1 Tax=Coemansia spiralis TaxID=417178 RepID=A0A9W8GM93_9FUNG|nr:hypothetical protein IWW39_001241 [Coemansia spiralis]